MAYNIFSQPRGPNIDTSLFPKSAALGLTTGKAVGTPLSNAIEGAISGVKSGLAIQSSIIANQAASIELETLPQVKAEELKQQQLDTQIKQNQVDRLGTTNKIQDLQLRVNELKVREAEQLEKLSLKSQEADLTDQINKSESDLKRRQDVDSFLDAFTKATPREQVAMVERSPGVLLDKTLQGPVFDALRLNRATPSAMREQLDVIEGRARVQSRAEKEAEDARYAYPEARSKYVTSSLSNKLAEALPNVPREYQSTAAIIVPSNQYELEGGKLKIGPDNQPIEIDGWATEPVKNYIAIDKARTRVLAQGVTEGEYKLWSDIKSAQELMDSTAANREADFVEKGIRKVYADQRVAEQQAKAAQNQPPAAPAAPAQSSDPLFGPRYTKFGVEADPVTNRIASTLGIREPEMLKKAQPKLDSIKVAVEKMLASGPDRVSAQADLNKTMSESVRSILLEEFETLTPTAKAQHEEEAKERDEEMLKSVPPSREKLVEPFLVRTGKNVYVINRLPDLLKRLNQILPELYKVSKTSNKSVGGTSSLKNLASGSGL